MENNQSIKNHVEEHLPHIRKIVSKIAFDKGIVDDITQECVVRIIEKEHLWDGNPSRVKGWINTLTRNLTIDWIKKEKKEKEKKFSLNDADVGHLPLDETFSELHIEWILWQFMELSEMQKKVLYLKYFKGLKNVEIEKELSLSHQAVSTHHKRALDALKKQAKKDGLLAWASPLALIKLFKNKSQAILNLGGKHIMIKTCIILALVGGMASLMDFNSQEPQLNFLEKSHLAQTKIVDHGEDGNKQDGDTDVLVASLNLEETSEEIGNDKEIENKIELATPQGIILKGIVTINGKPLTNTRVITYFNDADGKRIRTGNSFEFSCVTNEQGQYEIKGKVPKGAVSKDIFINNREGYDYLKEALHAIREYNYSKTVYDVDIKAPKSVKLFFQYDGQRINTKNLFCRSDLEIKGQLVPPPDYEAPTRSAQTKFYPYPFSVEELNSALENRGYGTSYGDEFTGDYLWFDHNVTEVVFYHRSGKAKSKTYLVDELFDGTIIDLNDVVQNVQLNTQIGNLENLRETFKDQSINLKVTIKQSEPWNGRYKEHGAYFEGNGYQFSFKDIFSKQLEGVAVNGDTISLSINLPEIKEDYDVYINLSSHIDKNLDFKHDSFLDLDEVFYGVNFKNGSSHLNILSPAIVHLQFDPSYPWMSSLYLWKRSPQSFFTNELRSFSNEKYPDRFWLSSQLNNFQFHTFDRGGVYERAKIGSLKSGKTTNFILKTKDEIESNIHIKFDFTELTIDGKEAFKDYRFWMKGYDKNNKKVMDHGYGFFLSPLTIDRGLDKDYQKITKVIVSAHNKKDGKKLYEAVIDPVSLGNEYIGFFKKVAGN